MEQDLSGKTYVVTGATSGIGLAAAEMLARQGAAIIGVGRTQENCRRAVTVLRQACPSAQVDYLLADLSVQSQVRVLAKSCQALLTAQGKSGLDGLLNNAGAFTYWLALTPDGIEMQWAVNHLAPFLLTRLLLPVLRAAPTARVVTVSSGSHRDARLRWDDLQLRRSYNGLLAYANTKLANVLFARHLNCWLGAGSSVRAFAADPGLVKTDIGMKGTPALAAWVWKLRRSGGISAQESALGVSYLLAEASIQDSPEIYWKHARPVNASRAAQDDSAAARLWDISEKMCGLQGEAVA